MSRVHHEEIVSARVVHVMDCSSHQNSQHLQLSEHPLQETGGEWTERGGGKKRERRLIQLLKALINRHIYGA